MDFDGLPGRLLLMGDSLGQTSSAHLSRRFCGRSNLSYLTNDRLSLALTLIYVGLNSLPGIPARLHALEVPFFQLVEHRFS